MRRGCYPSCRLWGCAAMAWERPVGVGQTNIPPWCGMAHPVPRECGRGSLVMSLWQAAPGNSPALQSGGYQDIRKGWWQLFDFFNSWCRGTLKGSGLFLCSSMCIHGYCRGIPQPWSQLWQAQEEPLPLSGVGRSGIMGAGDLTSAVPGDIKELKCNQFNMDEGWHWEKSCHRTCKN